MKRVLLVGGGGYVGAELQKALLELGIHVRVFDTLWYRDGKLTSKETSSHKNVEYMVGDVRDYTSVKKSLVDVDTVIHLACISNDPSYELDPQIAKEINYDAFKVFVSLVNDSSVERLVYASSSSVYGVKEENEVTEDLCLNPLTDYSIYKVKCEELIGACLNDNITHTILRPSTICGYSSRQRFDLVVNALTLSALKDRAIRVDGGDQFRPNLHIKDMIRAYILTLTAPKESVHRKTFNVAGNNLTVREIAIKVQEIVGQDVQIKYNPTVDARSYRISGKKINCDLGFTPLYTVEDAINDLVQAYSLGIFGDTTHEKYYNLRRMQTLIREGSLDVRKTT